MGRLHTVFNWTVHADQDPNPRFFRNFPMQGNGAELLRLACAYAVEAGVRVCAPVHDAILIEAQLSELDQAVAVTQALMVEASELVLGGFALRSDAKHIRYPDRYVDERGIEMWATVGDLLKEADLLNVAQDTCVPVLRDLW